MIQLKFIVEKCSDGKFRASAIGEDIHVEVDSPEQLRDAIAEAVKDHYDDQHNNMEFIIDLVIKVPKTFFRYTPSYN